VAVLEGCGQAMATCSMVCATVTPILDPWRSGLTTSGRPASLMADSIIPPLRCVTSGKGGVGTSCVMKKHFDRHLVHAGPAGLLVRPVYGDVVLLQHPARRRPRRSAVASAMKATPAWMPGPVRSSAPDVHLPHVVPFAAQGVGKSLCRS